MMPAKTYEQLLSLIQSLCGVTFASIELGRINAFVNRRASFAYRATNFWPRFLVVAKEILTVNGVIPYVDFDHDPIDTFIKIHKTLPYYSSSAQEYDYMVGPSGATLIAGSSNPTSAFVTYKIQNSSQYGTSSGETSEIPLEWFQYLGHAVYSDYLRSEGQQEKSQLADVEAQMILEEELMRIDNQRTPNMIGTRISTNSNFQMR